MTLRELHWEYFALYDDLRKAQASSNMPSDQYKAMAAVLKISYNQAIEDYFDEQLIAFSQQRFERKFKVRMYTPRRFLLFWWNPVAKKLLKQYKAEFKTYLAELKKDTREEEQYAQQLNDCGAKCMEAPSTALTLPPENNVALQQSDNKLSKSDAPE